MRFSERHEPSNLSSFLTGALVGAGVALLFAPQAGREMRVLLRDYAARAKDEFGGAVARGAEAWDSATEGGQEFVAHGKEAVGEAGSPAKGLAEEAKHKSS
ncbi:MAG: YtxH domain-containing protein [Nitrospirota bacterium]